MKIEWVNHASFVADYGGIRVMTDPWLEGTAFDDGWKHLSPTAFPYERFSTITHIWLSHEHPDHFSPLSLRSIPEDLRANITFLFQETDDRKVVKYLERLGWKDIVEMRRRRWYPLSDSFSVAMEPFPYGDSSLLIKTDRHRVANLNDCTIETPAHARTLLGLLGGPVDLLLTQYSYANWVGNPDDPEMRRRGAQEKLDAIRDHCRWLQPGYTIPFASFVWFCHSENAFMNDTVNRIGDVHELIARETSSRPIVLYPGETWEIGSEHDSASSIARYDEDLARIDSAELISSPPVPLAELADAGMTFRNTLVGPTAGAARNGRARFHKLHPTRIYLTDHDTAVELSVDHGVVEVDAAPNDCDIAASSGAIHNAFANLWGGDTLQINGRFWIPGHGDYMRFRRWMMLASKLNVHGSYRAFLRWRLRDVSRHPIHTSKRIVERLARRGRPSGGLTVQV